MRNSLPNRQINSISSQPITFKTNPTLLTKSILYYADICMLMFECFLTNMYYFTLPRNTVLETGLNQFCFQDREKIEKPKRASFVVIIISNLSFGPNRVSHSHKAQIWDPHKKLLRKMRNWEPQKKEERKKENSKGKRKERKEWE